MEHLAFLVLSALAGIYFLAGKRRFDLLTVGYLSSMLYFMPGLLGYAMVPVTWRGAMLPEDIAPATYWVFILVIGGLFAAALLQDQLGGDGEPTPAAAEMNPDMPGRVGRVALALGYLGLFLAVATLRQKLLLPKDELIAVINRWVFLWEDAATIACISAYLERDRRLGLLGALLLLGDMFIGFRTATAITILSVMLLFLHRRGARRMVVEDFKAIAGGVFFTAFMFIYKPLGLFLKMGRWDYLWQFMGTREAYEMIFEHSEPFGIQGILNRMIIKNYHVSGKHLTEILANFLPAAHEFGVGYTTFNSVFQPELFGGVKYGMGATVWGEMWAVGSWPLLTLFVACYAGAAVLGNRLLRRLPMNYHGIVAHAFVLFMFYLHRNGLGFQLGLQRRVVLLWIACYAVHLVVMRKAKAKAEEAGA